MRIKARVAAIAGTMSALLFTGGAYIKVPWSPARFQGRRPGADSGVVCLAL